MLLSEHIGITSIWGDHDRSSTARKGRGMDDYEMEEFEARVSQRVREQTIQEINSKIDALVKEMFMAFVAQIGLQVPN